MKERKKGESECQVALIFLKQFSLLLVPHRRREKDISCCLKAKGSKNLGSMMMVFDLARKK